MVADETICKDKKRCSNVHFIVRYLNMNKTYVIYYNI